MAKVKIGTAIDPTLLAKVRAIAVKEGRHLNSIIEESLERYLASRDLESQLRAVQRTRGRLRASPDLVREILEEPCLEA